MKAARIPLLLMMAFLLACQTPDRSIVSDPTFPLIQLPTDFMSHRENSNPGLLEAGDRFDILNVKGPGCVRSIWLLRAEGKIIEIVADGAQVPQVSMPAPSFFGTLLGFDPYLIQSAPLISMPNLWVKENFGGGEPGYTSYFPIPFQDSCRITLIAQEKGGLAAMVNWQSYNSSVELGPLRFHTSHTLHKPAPPRGSQISVADINGAGFIAGFFMGVRQLAEDDLMYHHGGYTFLIDGETVPHAIRGFNMEDDYGFTWGFHQHQTPWFGCPYIQITPIDNPVYPNSIFAYKQEAVAYRFMGPDPISFHSSLSMKLGTRPDDTEVVVYYYRERASKPVEVQSVEEWEIKGTLPCESREIFETLQPFDWDSLPSQKQPSDHTWINLHPLFFTSAWTPFARTKEAVLLKGTIHSDKRRRAKLKIAFDDWIGIWVNGHSLGNHYHESEFKRKEITIDLPSGDNEITIKTVNLNQILNNHLWAISVVVE
jgi:hypothetical protein